MPGSVISYAGFAGNSVLSNMMEKAKFVEYGTVYKRCEEFLGGYLSKHDGLEDKLQYRS